jgi:phosphoribosylformylglycinamidine synthase
MVVPKVVIETGNSTEIDLWISDEKLDRLGKRGIQNKGGTYRGPLGLGVDELKAIRTYFHNKGRLPTDIEIETLAQTWSEHCKHTIFANPIDSIKDGLYKSYIKKATSEVRKSKGKKDFCVSVFTDNSGVIAFDDDTVITHKVETHNSPSALDPFGGAVTGIVGVNRDTIGTGLGSKPIINYYGYCFADPRDKTILYRDSERRQELLSAKRIMDGVIEGVNAGGNQSGIPTPQGFMLFEKRFRGKPLVFVGTVGMMPRKINGKESYIKSARPGDMIVMVGGRVGLDGVHGATFSSVALDSGSPATAVQIGDPITQKKLSDALIKEARDRGLYTSITDNGAGGLSSSVGEMAEQSGGCLVYLDEVPLKYSGLSPWQIWISESQERMTLSVPPNKWLALKNLLEKRGVEATVIGEFTDSGYCIATYRDREVLKIDMDFLHNGLPIQFQETKVPTYKLKNPPNSIRKRYSKDLAHTLVDMLKRPNLSSCEFISRQYDHEVQGSSVTKPLQGKGQVNALSTVSRPKMSSYRGVVLSQGINPTFSDIDTYHMAACAIDTAIRNTVSAGVDPNYLALLDNFCWCSSDEKERLYELKRAAEACYDYAVAYGTPFISGKDSMFNDFKGYTKKESVKISIPPTLLISSIGIIPDIRKAVTLDPKRVGDKIYLIGGTFDEMAGTEYFAHISEKEDKTYVGNVVPKVDAEKNLENYKCLHKAIMAELVSSCLSVTRGGLGIALAKASIAGQRGLDIDVKKIAPRLSSDTLLFSESQGRMLVTVSPEKCRDFEALFSKRALKKIGSVSQHPELTIMSGPEQLVKISIPTLTHAYKRFFSKY